MRRDNDIPEERNSFPSTIFYAARQALRRHASGGNILILATIVAMLLANIPAASGWYADFWQQEIRLQIGGFNIFSHSGHPMSLLAFINDALMAIFFFTIGLEIKREILVGELSSLRRALLPIIAAVGGMIIPVGMFLILSRGTDYASGAAIPMATDIAFTLGLLGMFGNRVPVSLKIFLTTLAVVDDIGGIIVIAVCYSSHIQWVFIAVAIALLAILLFGSMMRIQSKIFYLGIGGVIWFLFLNSGIHPTIAGVLVAFCIPSKPVFCAKKYVRDIRSAISHFHIEDDDALSKRSILTPRQLDWLKQIESASDKVISPLQDLEDSLHPVVNYFIVPLFAFANAGISFHGISPTAAFEGLSLTIILSLVLGKFLGIWLFSWGTVKLGITPAPKGADWKMMAGIAALGGIGFTVSLFIANLSFDSATSTGLYLLNLSKLGIVAGSLIAGIIGILILRATLPRNR